MHTNDAEYVVIGDSGSRAEVAQGQTWMGDDDALRGMAASRPCSRRSMESRPGPRGIAQYVEGGGPASPMRARRQSHRGLLPTCAARTELTERARKRSFALG
jgi:hypothetical protein